MAPEGQAQIKSFPLQPLPGQLPPLRGGSDSHCLGELKTLPYLPPQSGGTWVEDPEGGQRGWPLQRRLKITSKIKGCPSNCSRSGIAAQRG
jgi:hypothetical protein